RAPRALVEWAAAPAPVDGGRRGSSSLGSAGRGRLVGLHVGPRAAHDRGREGLHGSLRTPARTRAPSIDARRMPLHGTNPSIDGLTSVGFRIIPIRVGRDGAVQATARRAIARLTIEAHPPLTLSGRAIAAAAGRARTRVVEAAGVDEAMVRVLRRASARTVLLGRAGRGPIDA